jgi:hypothetical protein
MSAEHDLAESWKYIPMLQRQVALQGETLKEQAQWLGLQVDHLINENHNGWEEPQKFEVLAKLSLLSEIYSLVDFDRMIETREKFQELFPEHFAEYLGSLDSLVWQISWPGCLECSHFDGKCSLGLTPTEVPGGSHNSPRQCKSKEMRLKAA